MVEKSKAECQADLALLMELYFAASMATEEDPDLMDDAKMEDELLGGNGANPKVFEILGLQTLQDVGAMSGDGSHWPYNQQPKSKDWFLSSLLSANRDFHKTFQYGKKPQAHVKVPLGCFLVQYGRRASEVAPVAHDMDVGIGSVNNHTRQECLVFHYASVVGMAAMCIRQRSHNYLGICIIVNRNITQCTQGNIQATMDHEHHFTSYDMGWPGSVLDMKVWKQSHLWVHKHQYFKNGWYILGIHPLPMLFDLAV
ncbi:hypothetical protein PILCRDRAFT_93387 [Piloderma croceum F 1598]|uniref:Uncharacterized protein n=1 Tax=Piloderma croceum (strain F 1598) TaxID=765440 RepID=A0A0C3B5T1_PILCF|nr:hypothetical protein PILCRDRAFT_93387 [Piloderma croceum F 1598]